MKKVIISLMLIILIVGMTGCNSSRISEDTYAEKAKVIFVSEMEQGDGDYIERVQNVTVKILSGNHKGKELCGPEDKPKWRG